MTRPWGQSVSILRYTLRNDGKDESDKDLKWEEPAVENPQAEMSGQIMQFVTAAFSACCSDSVWTILSLP